MQNIQNRFVAIILARGGSKGIKLKNLIKINGKLQKQMKSYKKNFGKFFHRANISIVLDLNMVY